MSSNTSLDLIYDFVHQKKTVSSTWEASGFSAPGNLSWDGDRPILRLNYYAKPKERDGIQNQIENLPICKTCTPPAMISLKGFHHELGFITLKGCFCSNTREKSLPLKSGEHAKYVEISLLPSQIWVHGPRFDFNTTYQSVSLYDTRLKGLFGQGKVELLDRMDEKFDTVSELLGNPENVWVTHAPEVSGVPLGTTGASLSLSETVSQSWSAIGGELTQSRKVLNIKLKDSTDLDSASGLVYRLQGLISTAALSHFEFQLRKFISDDGAEAFQVWRLGQQADIFKAPMAHQSLINFSNEDSLRKSCAEWFIEDKVDNLAKWLFLRALKETNDGFARFINVCQAFEVQARNLDSGKPVPTEQMKEALQSIKEALKGMNFEEEQSERWLNLIRSSNRMSFKDGLVALLSCVPDGLFKYYGSDDRQGYCKEVSNLRNTLVHMSDNNKGKLQDGFSSVNKRSHQVTVLFALCILHKANIPIITDLNTALVNNETARYGIPNSTLDSFI